MKIPYDNLKDLAEGCCEVRVEHEGLLLDRMNAALHKIYVNGNIRRRACSTAGVRLRFRCDSSWVWVSFKYGETVRPYLEADLFVDGVPAGSYGPRQKTHHWAGEIFSADSREERKFELWLPYSVQTWVDWLEIEAGSQIHPAKANLNVWLALGDSITQGMTATSPSLTYASVAARATDLNLHNIGVGGRTMQTAVGKAANSISCSLATIAFGINDWARCKALDRYRQDTLGLLAGLLDRKKHLPIGLISPLPVVGKSETNEAGVALEEFRKVLRAVADESKNVTVIEGPSLVPADPDYFVDGVHPNDRGMEEMGKNLAPHLKALLPDSA